jgi:hypothetical protein
LCPALSPGLQIEQKNRLMKLSKEIDSAHATLSVTRTRPRRMSSGEIITTPSPLLEVGMELVTEGKRLIEATQRRQQELLILAEAFQKPTEFYDKNAEWMERVVEHAEVLKAHIVDLVSKTSETSSEGMSLGQPTPAQSPNVSQDSFEKVRAAATAAWQAAAKLVGASAMHDGASESRAHGEMQQAATSMRSASQKLDDSMTAGKKLDTVSEQEDEEVDLGPSPSADADVRIKELEKQLKMLKLGEFNF